MMLFCHTFGALPPSERQGCQHQGGQRDGAHGPRAQRWDRAETNAIIAALCCSLVATAYGAWRGANFLRREGPGWWRAARGAQRCIACLSTVATVGSCSRVCSSGPGMLEHLEEAAGERAAEEQNKSARASSDG